MVGVLRNFLFAMSILCEAANLEKNIYEILEAHQFRILLESFMIQLMTVKWYFTFKL